MVSDEGVMRGRRGNDVSTRLLSSSHKKLLSSSSFSFHFVSVAVFVSVEIFSSFAFAIAMNEHSFKEDLKV